MTGELRTKIISLYECGVDIDGICFETGAVKGEARRVISEECARTLEHAVKRGNHRYEDTLYARHLSGTSGRIA